MLRRERQEVTTMVRGYKKIIRDAMAKLDEDMDEMRRENQSIAQFLRMKGMNPFMGTTLVLPTSDDAVAEAFRDLFRRRHGG